MQQWFIWSLGLIVLLSLILFSGGPAQLNEEELVCLDKLGCPGTSQLSLIGIYCIQYENNSGALLYCMLASRKLLREKRSQSVDGMFVNYYFVKKSMRKLFPQTFPSTLPPRFMGQNE